MDGVVKAMDKAMGSMNLEQASSFFLTSSFLVFYFGSFSFFE